MALDLQTLKQRLTDPASDGLWLRDRLMLHFVDGGAARPIAPPPGAPTPHQGAVLALLYPHDGEICLPLTVRNAALRKHSGEVSLPGGRFDEDDRELRRTALREAWEELAITPAAVTLWSTLTTVWIPVSNFQITPFVGWSDLRPEFTPATSEVAELIEVPLRTLIDPTIIRAEEWERNGVRMHVPFFQVGEYKVWGATALVLAELVGKLVER
ncbi:MAG TPA: CoA pyrophosphatase [Herpetosiphonaceae bacterium]